MAKIMVLYGRPNRSFWAKSVWSSFGRTIIGKAIWENPIETLLGENSNWECLFVHREIGLFLSVHVDDIKLTGKNKILIQCGNYSMKKLIWGNQHLSLIMYTWDALNDNTKQAKILWTITEPCSNHEFQRGESREITIPSKFSYFFMVLWHGWLCREMCGTILWVDGKTTQQLNKISIPCIDDHNFKEEETKSVGELSHVCSQMVLKCLYLARIGRPDILGSVHKLARSINKMDQGMWQTPKSIDFTFFKHVNVNNIVMWEMLLNNTNWGLFQDSDFAGDLEDSNRRNWKSYICFQLVGCVRNKLLFLTAQQNLKLSPLDTRLKLDGLPAPELWDLNCFCLLEIFSHISGRTGQPVNGKKRISQQKSMLCRTLILFLQMSNPRTKKL